MEGSSIGPIGASKQIKALRSYNASMRPVGGNDLTKNSCCVKMRKINWHYKFFMVAFSFILLGGH